MDIQAWLKDSQKTLITDTIKKLEECQNILSEEVKIPLNVSCSDVLRGLLTRSGAEFEAKGSAWKSLEFQTRSSDQPQSVPVKLKISQVEALYSALQLAAYFLNLQSIDEAIEVLDRVEQLCEVPPHSVRFPTRRLPLGAVGVCGEVFICERENIVFSVRAYQDTAPLKFVATDTLSSKETDCSLQKVWTILDDVRSKLQSRLPKSP